MKTDKKKLENDANGREYKIIKHAEEPYTECYGYPSSYFKAKQGRVRQCEKRCFAWNKFKRNWKRFRLVQWKE